MPRGKPSGHLVGAFGLFWARGDVPWDDFGRGSVPLLGKRGERRPKLRVCDFRQAVGSYILYDDYGPVYTGIAESPGLGARLWDHHQMSPSRTPWTRFSWFAFGDVRDLKSAGWSAVSRRSRPVASNAEATVREIEALLISVLGTEQNRMRFQVAGDQWSQLDDAGAMNLHNRSAVDQVLFPRKLRYQWSQDQL